METETSIQSSTASASEALPPSLPHPSGQSGRFGRGRLPDFMKAQDALTDLSAMPFGKYRGTPMQDVPAGYLHWLWVNGLKDDKVNIVAVYIRENIAALKTEYPDGIWT